LARRREVAVAIKDITEAESLRHALDDRWKFHGLVCASGEMKEVVTLVRELAPFDSTVLVLGESGTGKEVIARAMHEESKRRLMPFVTVNCSAYSEGLLESELFGHAAGSFTGAMRDRQGRFESANGGTVFLDEIGEISPTIQVKLLRVLQERTFRRLGGTEEIEADIRIIAATNRDLARLIAEGRFREDLFYRINVIPLQLPPLRDRHEDIPLLAEHFLDRFRQQMGKPIEGFSAEALRRLEAYGWPGNVRQLENVIERAVALERGTSIQVEALPADVCQWSGESHRAGPGDQGTELPEPGRDLPELGRDLPAAGRDLPAGLDLPRHLEFQEKEYVAQALRQAAGRHDRAARLLSISPRQFRYLLDKHRLR
jgi:transcriptional regulator with GAF, ATPase, and Fis domain